MSMLNYFVASLVDIEANRTALHKFITSSLEIKNSFKIFDTAKFLQKIDENELAFRVEIVLITQA